jgi:AbrB family looped-hinge helix DNA binding protein
MKTLVSGKGQVVIPKQIREAIPIKKGDELEVELRGKVIVLKPIMRFQAEKWQDYIGIGEGIVNNFLRDKKKEKEKEDVYS